MVRILDILIPRHSHAEILNDIDPNMLAYKESDMLDAMKEYGTAILEELEERLKQEMPTTYGFEVRKEIRKLKKELR